MGGWASAAVTGPRPGTPRWGGSSRAPLRAGRRVSHEREGGQRLGGRRSGMGRRGLLLRAEPANGREPGVQRVEVSQGLGTAIPRRRRRPPSRCTRPGLDMTLTRSPLPPRTGPQGAWAGPGSRHASGLGTPEGAGRRGAAQPIDAARGRARRGEARVPASRGGAARGKGRGAGARLSQWERQAGARGVASAL